MKKQLLFLILCTLSFSAFSQNETALIEAVKRKLEKVKDYSATGTMNLDVSFINAPSSKVVMYYKAPDKFTVQKEGGISILPKGGVSVNLASLVAGTNYAIVPAGKSTWKGQLLKLVKLLPLDDKSNVVLTTFFIDEKALLIRKAQVTTRDNGSYEIEMEYGKWSAWGLPDKMVFLFSTKEYKLPKGVTFEYEKGAKKTAPAKDSKGSVSIIYNNYSINKGVSDEIFGK
jgi:hypothetical protein